MVLLSPSKDFGHVVMERRTKFLVALVVLFVILLGPTPRRSITGANNDNTLATYKHQGPNCNVSSLDLYRPQSNVCPDRRSMLEAMSSGGRIGVDAPYTARGCDLKWFSTKEVCKILNRFDQVVLVGDSMLRHVMGAVNIFIREDLGYGAVADWNFSENEKRECFGSNQFNVESCSVQGIYKTSDVLAKDPTSVACRRLVPGWSADVRVEQINQYPVPDEELLRLADSIHVQATKPRAFVLGHGLGDDLDIDKSSAWLEAVLHAIEARTGESTRGRALLITPNAAGKQKDDDWIITQGNKALKKFEERMAKEAGRQGIEHLGTWNMSVQATLYDGTHMDMRGNLLKGMMVLNWLNLLDG